MANEITKISDIINPEVMADMISAKIPDKIAVTPFAKVDNTLSGVPGDTITVPKYAYIGDAGDISEGESVETSKLTASTATVKVKKAMKAVSITDEAILSGYGNPVGEANNQLAMAIASKVDSDAMDALLGAQLSKDLDKPINYSGIVDAIDVFAEEANTSKVMFVHPHQVSQLRKDADFISADKYPGNVIMSGEVGMIANTRVVPSKKVALNDTEYYSLTEAEPADWSAKYKTYYTKSGEAYTAVTGTSAPEWAENTYYKKAAAGSRYICPIVKLTQDNETEDETAALTIYMKRGVNLETERHTLSRTTDISVDQFYTAALSDASKVVLAKFPKQ